MRSHARPDHAIHHGPDFRTNELHHAGVDGFLPFGRIAHHQYRLAKGWRFFLNAA
jgi:hypothetical protein